MARSDRKRHNVIVFPVRSRNGVSDRADEDLPDVLKNYFNGRSVRYVTLSPLLERHFGTGWRSILSTGLTGVALGLLVAIICVYC